MSTTLALHLLGGLAVVVWLYLKIRGKNKPTYYGGQNKAMGNL